MGLYDTAVFADQGCNGSALWSGNDHIVAAASFALAFRQGRLEQWDTGRRTAAREILEGDEGFFRVEVILSREAKPGSQGSDPARRDRIIGQSEVPAKVVSQGFKLLAYGYPDQNSSGPFRFLSVLFRHRPFRPFSGGLESPEILAARLE